MGVVKWTGGALPVAQVDTITVANVWATGDTVTLTINGKDLVLTVGTDTTTAQVATAIKEMFNGNTQTGTGDHTFSETGNNVPEFSEATATISGSVVTITADTKGKPFTLSVTETTAGSGTATEATATNPTGPNHWDNTDNWDTGSVPVNSDDVYIEIADAEIKYGLAQSAVTLASLYARGNSQIGLARLNQDGTDYPEYRDQFLQIGATICEIETTESLVKIDFGSTQTATIVRNSGIGFNERAVILHGTNTSNTIEVQGGEVETGSELASDHWDSVFVTEGDILSGPNVDLGDATIKADGGTVDIQSACGTVDVFQGASIVIAGNITTLNSYPGSRLSYMDGTITTANLEGLVDTTQDLTAKTISTLNHKPKGKLLFRPGTLTITTYSLDSRVSSLSAS